MYDDYISLDLPTRKALPDVDHGRMGPVKQLRFLLKVKNFYKTLYKQSCT